MTADHHRGLTVVEACYTRLAQISKEIDQLQQEKAKVMYRLNAYRYSTMLESERIATAAEAYQKEKLKENCNVPDSL